METFNWQRALEENKHKVWTRVTNPVSHKLMAIILFPVGVMLIFVGMFSSDWIHGGKGRVGLIQACGCQKLDWTCSIPSSGENVLGPTHCAAYSLMRGSVLVCIITLLPAMIGYTCYIYFRYVKKRWLTLASLLHHVSIVAAAVALGTFWILVETHEDMANYEPVAWCLVFGVLALGISFIVITIEINTKKNSAEERALQFYFVLFFCLLGLCLFSVFLISSGIMQMKVSEKNLSLEDFKSVLEDMHRVVGILDYNSTGLYESVADIINPTNSSLNTETKLNLWPGYCFCRYIETDCHLGNAQFEGVDCYSYFITAQAFGWASFVIVTMLTVLYPYLATSDIIEMSISPIVAMFSILAWGFSIACISMYKQSIKNDNFNDFTRQIGSGYILYTFGFLIWFTSIILFMVPIYTGARDTDYVKLTSFSSSRSGATYRHFSEEDAAGGDEDDDNSEDDNDTFKKD